MGQHARRVISTWFYEQGYAEGGTYHQIRGDSASEAFRDVYRRCVAVFFASARRANADAELRLYVNREWRNDASTVAAETSALLARLGVEIEVLNYAFAPPASWSDAWRNQFFVFDVLAALSRRYSDLDCLICLDSDVVWTNNASTETMWEEVAQQGCVTYQVDYPFDEEINGISRQELSRIAASFSSGVRLDEMIGYSGGEYIALRRDVCLRVVDTARHWWPEVMRRHEASEIVPTEEAHFLSCIYALLDLQVGTGDAYIKRIWTQVRQYRNVQVDDLDLALWHVPAEKRFGLLRLYRDLMARPGESWVDLPQELFVQTVGAYLGIPRSSVRKGTLDLLLAVRSRIYT